MELVEGDALGDVIRREGRLRPVRAAHVGAQVAEALGYAHGRGVVHRDVKPGNILVEPGDHVKVADFGIAEARNADSLNAAGTLVGTPAYMSPEQARGWKVDGRSDLFSLGCVLYETLTGRRAFAGDSITGLVFKVIAEQPTPIREVAPRVPAELARIVEGALQKDPGSRPASGRELAESLLAFARDLELDQ
jgi:serine/threonine-protein kinase